ncbi:MAG TPA: magnesium transporter, partial [Bacteroidia bacterium]|nr:magnesium transporter [Bacteroidia bacterium]
MQFELTSELLSSLKENIEEKNASFLKEQLHDLYPQDIALIINQLRLEEAAYIYELLDDDTAPDVLLELDDDKRE